MNDELPRFRKRRYADVMQFINRVLTNPAVGSQSHLYRLIEYDDGHYRAIFSPAYFQHADRWTEPSKSQWNTLKKRMKRYQKRVFVFRTYGEIDCSSGEMHSSTTDNGPCYYLDFGFFAYG